MLRHYYTVLGFPPLVRRGKQPNVPVNKYRYEGGGASNISFGDCVVGNKTNVNIKKNTFLTTFFPLVPVQMVGVNVCEVGRLTHKRSTSPPVRPKRNTLYSRESVFDIVCWTVC